VVSKRYNVAVHTGHEVTAIDHDARTLTGTRLQSGESFSDEYDFLVLATGVSSSVPPIPNIDLPGLFTLRSLRDAEQVRAFVDSHQPDHAVVIGGGYIGLEVAEHLLGRGIAVTLVEAEHHTMPRMDADMSARVDEELRRQGVDLRTGQMVTALAGDAAVRSVELDDRTGVSAQLVVVATGVQPNVDLARELGVALGPTGAIAVDTAMRTSVTDVFAVGDVAESSSAITGEPMWVPLGSTAKHGLGTGLQPLRREHQPPGLPSRRARLSRWRRVATGPREVCGREGRSI
jgi:NADPH-dependent 2,4-dienoyl-CoA reductase/sulfur reductase-like enzyme